VICSNFLLVTAVVGGFMRSIFFGGVVLASMAVASMAQASSLTYKPVSPSFGGDSFNGTYLLSTAQANNHYVKPREVTNPLDNFERTITSSILSRVSTQIAERIFGDNPQNSGRFQLGNTLLTFQRNGDTVDIVLFDGVTGSSTTINVPAPQL
jgi:curli production assembly/transport component CsgF